jgi:lysylphosphatidylglycerol synthetase-like protein (DUF2156 family)
MNIPHDDYIKDISYLKEKIDFLRKFGGTDTFLLLEPDPVKRYYFVSKKVEGYLGFGVCMKTAIVIGGIISQPEDRLTLVEEFKEYCKSRYKRIMFFNVRDKTALLLRQANFQISHLGSEAILDPTTFNSSGRRMRNVRQTANKAGKSFTVREVISSEEIKKIYPKLIEIDSDFLQRKATKSMGFFVGNLNLENLEDKRLFIAESNKRVEGYVFCFPMFPGNNYRPELYRKRFESTGVIELMLLYILKVLKEEKVSHFTLGLCPFIKASDDPISTKSWPSTLNAKVGRLMDTLANFSPGAFGPGSLWAFKKKFRPDFFNYFNAMYPKMSIMGFLAQAKMWGLLKIRFSLLIKNYYKHRIRI